MERRGEKLKGGKCRKDEILAPEGMVMGEVDCPIATTMMMMMNEKVLE